MPSKCEHPGCDSRPNFDIKGGKGRFCVMLQGRIMALQP